MTKVLTEEETSKMMKTLAEQEREVCNTQLDCRNKSCKHYTTDLENNCSQFYLLNNCNNYTVRFHDLDVGKEQVE